MKMWIARATNNVLTLHQFEPEKLRMDEESDDYFWASDIETISFLNRNLFPEVTFENSPMEVELVIKSQNNVTECYNCHEVIKFTENDVIDGWYVKCPCCGEEISILL